MNDFKDAAIGLFGTAFFIVLISLALGLYFLPSFIARKKQNSAAIFVLNLLLGWTFLGWVVALVWALTKDRNK